jgi:hypothetical protein
VFSGHVLGDGTGYRSTLNDGGKVVHQMLANYQVKGEGGRGDLRVLEFKPDGETVVVRTYSPSLDRYDTAFDQQFTLNMNQIHGPLMPSQPPLIPHSVAANLTAVGATNPVDNIVDNVLVPQSTSPGITVTNRNRGDYELAVGGNALKYQHGVLLSSIRQHERPDFVGKRATVEAGRNSFSNGNLTLSVMEAGNFLDNEVNFNTSVAWFQFQARFQGAHVNSSGSVPAGASYGIFPSQVTRQAAGRFEVNLGPNAANNGMLFATGNNNNNTVVSTAPLANGMGWQVRVDDNATDIAVNGQDLHDWSFVYLRYDTQGLIGGNYDGIGNANITSVGNFSLNRLGTGQYELNVVGQTPDTGMLIMQVNHLATEGSITAPADNILTYEASGTGSFLINSYDLPGIGFQDTKFSWAFISFDNPLFPSPASSGIKVGDYNLDGYVDVHDYRVWKVQSGMTGTGLAADGNRDNVVNAGDYVIWRNSLSGPVGPAVTVPEPASTVLAALAVSFLGVVFGRRCRHSL